MSLRELIIKLAVRSDARQATQLSSVLDGLRARVSRLDTGLGGMGSAAVGAGRSGTVAFGQLGTSTDRLRANLTGVAGVAERAGAAIRQSISNAAQASEGAMSSMLRRVSAAGASVSSGPRPAARKRETAGDSAPSGGGTLGNLVAGAAGGAIVAGALALKGYASAALEAAGRINDLRAATGANAKVIQTWDAIVTQAGGSPETLAKGLKGLNKALSDASKGNKDAVGAFRELGVATKNADGSARPLGTVLREAGGALGDITDASKKAALAQTLFGKAGFDLLPAFEGGTAAVNEQVASFSKLAALNDEQVTKLDATGDSLDTLKLKLAGIGAKALVAFGPLIDVLSTTAIPLLESLAAAVMPLIDVVATGLKPVLESLKPVFEQVFGVLGPIVGELAPIFAQLISQVSPLLPLLVGALLPVVVALAPVVVQLANAFLPLVEQLLPPLVELIQALSPVVVFLAQALSGALGPAIGVVSAWVSTLIAGFDGAVKTIRLVGSALQVLWATFFGGPAAIEAAGAEITSSLEAWWTSVVNIGEKIRAYFSELWTGIGDTVSGIFSGAGGKFGGAGATVNVANNSTPFSATAATLGGSGSSQTTTNNMTLRDERTVSVSVSTPAPSAIAAAVGPAVSNALDVDRRRIQENMSPGSR